MRIFGWVIRRRSEAELDGYAKGYLDGLAQAKTTEAPARRDRSHLQLAWSRATSTGRHRGRPRWRPSSSDQDSRHGPAA